MNNFTGNNINAIRIHYGLSQEQFAKVAGVSQTAVSAWECGESTPRRSNVMKILAAMPELTSDDIVSEENGFAKKVLRESRSSRNDWVEVPFYGSIAAGNPIEILDVDETYLIPPKIAKQHPHCGVLRVCGNSWNKEIPDGYCVVVDLDITIPKNDREPFALCIDGDTATIKAIQRLENGVRLIPNSYDPTIQPIVFDYGSNDGRTVATIGKVIWAFAPFNYNF